MLITTYEQSDNFKAYVDAIQAKSYENLVAIHNRSSLVFTSDVIKEVCKLPKDAEGLKIRGYLIKNDCQIDSKILLHNSNYLRLASQQNIPLDDMVCVYFASSDEIDFLKYAYSKNYKLTKMVLDKSAKCDYVDCLKFALENGCIYDDETTNIVNKYQSINCIDYLKSH